MANWNLFVLDIVLILVILHQVRNVFKNLHRDDTHAQNFAAQYAIHLYFSHQLPRPIKMWVPHKNKKKILSVHWPISGGNRYQGWVDPALPEPPPPLPSPPSHLHMSSFNFEIIR